MKCGEREREIWICEVRRKGDTDIEIFFPLNSEHVNSLLSTSVILTRNIDVERWIFSMMLLDIY